MTRTYTRTKYTVRRVSVRIEETEVTADGPISALTHARQWDKWTETEHREHHTTVLDKTGAILLTAEHTPPQAPKAVLAIEPTEELVAEE